MKFSHRSLQGGFCGLLNSEVNSRELTRSFSQEELTDMQWDLLTANFDGPKTIALLRDKIRDTSSGPSSHLAGVLKAALKKAFELGKKKRPPPSVRLRCANFHCIWHHNYVSYSAIGSEVFCRICLDRSLGYYFLQCLGCGFNRTASCTSCQHCGKMFV